MDKSFVFHSVWVDHIENMSTLEKGQFLEKILVTENLFRGYNPQSLLDKETLPVVQKTEIVDKSRLDINNLIFLIKSKCKEIKIPYQSEKDRMFAKHILSAKEFGEFAENINLTREELAINIMLASIKIGYWKGVCSGPMSIYQNYSEVYNQTVAIKQKQQKDNPVRSKTFIV